MLNPEKYYFKKPVFLLCKDCSNSWKTVLKSQKILLEKPSQNQVTLIKFCRIWCGHFLSSSGLIFWSLFFRGGHSRPDGALLYTIISEFPWKKCRRHAMLRGRKKGPSCSFWKSQEDIIWWVVLVHIVSHKKDDQWNLLTKTK